MSGNNTNTANTANTANNYPTFTGETSEFGMRVFSDSTRQALYKLHEDEYKKKYALKQAYDKQELLHKMRADIKREYLTRKKQFKLLQNDAAVDFRNAEMSLQEHYAYTYTRAKGQRYIVRGIDITAPLVSAFMLPTGEIFDIKAFSTATEFKKVVELHTILDQESENERNWMEWQQAQNAQEYSWCQTPPSTSTSTSTSTSSRQVVATRDISDLVVADPDNFGNCDGGNCNCDLEEEEEGYEYSDDEDDYEYYDHDQDHDHDQDQDQDHEESEPTCDDIPAFEPKERHASIPIAATNTIISAKKKAAAGAAKARIAKQQKKRQQQQQQKGKKFVPLQVTDNTNRTNEVTAVLTANKLEINMSKKTLQNASREAKKHYKQKWNQTNAAAKQINARGTKIPELRVYSKWDCNSYSDEE